MIHLVLQYSKSLKLFLVLKRDSAHFDRFNCQKNEQDKPQISSMTDEFSPNFFSSARCKMDFLQLCFNYLFDDNFL